MTLKRITVAGLVGVAIPSVWLGMYHRSPEFARWWIEAPSFIEMARLLLWPTSLLLIADPRDSNMPLWIVSIVSNGLIYIGVISVFSGVKVLVKGGS